MRGFSTLIITLVASCGGDEGLSRGEIEGTWTMTTTIEELEASLGNCVHTIGTTSTFEVAVSVIEDTPGGEYYVTFGGLYGTIDSMVGAMDAWPSLTLDGFYKLRGFPVRSTLQLLVASATEISGEEQWLVSGSGKWDCHGRSTVELAR